MRGMVPPAETDDFGLLRGRHDRTRLFCGVLEVLADDLFQMGRETMALALGEYLNGELAQLLRWEREELLPDFSAAVPYEGAARAARDRFIRRHRAIADRLPSLVNGLDLIASGRLPDRPLDFVLEVLSFAETVRFHLDSQVRDFLPELAAALPAAEIERLDARLAGDGADGPAVGAIRSRSGG